VSRRLLAWFLAATAAAAMPPLSAALQARTPVVAQAEPLLPQPEVLRPLLLGFHPIVADLYWLRTVQYFGEHIQTDGQFPHLYPLVNFVTSLDRQFMEAFQLGGLFLVIAGRYPEAVAIYEKGIGQHPERWELPYDLGRLYFLELKDDAQALRWWQVADRLPGRPHYLPRFIARLHARTGSLETALQLWKGILETSDNAWVRKRAAEEIAALLEKLQALEPARSGGARGR